MAQQLDSIRPSNSPWASHLHMVAKQTPGEWRPCGNYRTLNAATKSNCYTIPFLQDFSASLCGKTIFSNVPKTMVITPCGPFKCVGMPFGLRKALQTLQQYRDDFLWELDFALALLAPAQMSSCPT